MVGSALAALAASAAALVAARGPDASTSTDYRADAATPALANADVAPALEGVRISLPERDEPSQTSIQQCSLDGETANPLFRHRALSKTRTLQISKTHLTLAAVEALLRSPIADQIESIMLLAGVVVDPGGLHLLLRLPHLRSLTIYASATVGMDDLIGADKLGRRGLVLVNLDVQSLQDATLRALARTSGKTIRLDVAVDLTDFARLSRTGLLGITGRLMLSCGDACAGSLSRSRQLGALESLFLGSADCLTIRTAIALAAARLPRLRNLDVESKSESCAEPPQSPGIGVEGLKALLAASFAPKLERLGLNGQGIGDQGARLIEAASLPRLLHLKIGADHLSSAAVRTLVRSSKLGSRLQTLALTGSDEEGRRDTLDSQAFSTLAREARLPALRRLDVGYNRYITEAALLKLAAAPWLAQLEDLDMENLNLSEPAAARFATLVASYRVSIRGLLGRYRPRPDNDYVHILCTKDRSYPGTTQ